MHRNCNFWVVSGCIWYTKGVADGSENVSLARGVYSYKWKQMGSISVFFPSSGLWLKDEISWKWMDPAFEIQKMLWCYMDVCWILSECSLLSRTRAGWVQKIVDLLSLLFYLTGKMKSLVQLKTEGRAFTNKSKEVFKKTNILNCSQDSQGYPKINGMVTIELKMANWFSGKRSMFMIYSTCQESWMGLYSICSWT